MQAVHAVQLLFPVLLCCCAAVLLHASSRPCLCVGGGCARASACGCGCKQKGCCALLCTVQLSIVRLCQRVRKEPVRQPRTAIRPTHSMQAAQAYLPGPISVSFLSCCRATTRSRRTKRAALGLARG
jgi:hypothetical protein